MSAFENALNTINNLLDPITPTGVSGIEFITVFLIIYGIIQILISRTKIFSNNKQVQLIISLAIAYFTASSTFAVLLITKLFPQVGIITIIIISFFAVIAVVNPEYDFKKGMPVLGGLVLIIFIGIIVNTIWTSASNTLIIEGIQFPELSAEDYYGIMFIGLIILFIILIYFSGGGQVKTDKFGERLIKWLNWPNN